MHITRDGGYSMHWSRDFAPQCDYMSNTLLKRVTILILIYANDMTNRQLIHGSYYFLESGSHRKSPTQCVWGQQFGCKIHGHLLWTSVMFKKKMVCITLSKDHRLKCTKHRMCHRIGCDAPHGDGGHAVVEEIEVCKVANSHTWIYPWGDHHTPTLDKAFHYRSIHLNHNKTCIY